MSDLFLPPDQAPRSVPDLSVLEGSAGVPTDPPATINTGKLCAWPDGCDRKIPGHGETGFSPSRKYCDEHSAEAARTKGRKNKGDKAPGDVRLTVELGGGKAGRNAVDQRVAKVTAGATQMVQTAGALVTMGGDPICGQTLIDGAPALGKALGDLSRYQPVLAKIFAPTGEMTGQGFAWIAVVAAAAGIMVPILNHHGVVSDDLALKFTGGMGAMAGMAGVADPADDAA